MWAERGGGNRAWMEEREGRTVPTTSLSPLLDSLFSPRGASFQAVERGGVGSLLAASMSWGIAASKNVGRTRMGRTLKDLFLSLFSSLSLQGCENMWRPRENKKKSLTNEPHCPIIPYVRKEGGRKKEKKDK